MPTLCNVRVTMCGIAGIVDFAGGQADTRQALERMQACLRHRGPDDEGIYISELQTPNSELRTPSAHDWVCGLAHTRLAILDLSPAGHQPMSSPDGRYHITFNGEIYNFRTLRKQLEAKGRTFRSETDTEVVLQMYERLGPDCVNEFAGMFAFAIWDELEQTCFLARGPLGVKPLYYSQRGGSIAFASEIRALLKSGLAPARLSAAALRGYLMFGSVQEPETLIEGVHCLPAGHHLMWRQGEVTTQCYWRVEFHDDLFTRDEAVSATRAALEDSVRRHFVSDVPVGIFLSGGIDSTALVALARRTGVKELRTFCISFGDPKLNEGEAAGRTARHFDTEHFDWRLDSTAGKALIKEFLARLDQPSIDGFNTFCVSKHAHDRGAKVVLSGLGGDELFGGYRSFRLVPRLAKLGRWASLAGPLTRSFGCLLEGHMARPQHRRLGRFLAGPPSMARAYGTMRGVFTSNEVENLVRVYLPTDSEHGETMKLEVPAQPTAEDEVSFLEISRYMRNQLLRDSDVMSMAWGLELRVPFVDRKLVETLSRIPAALRLSPGKRLLLEAVPEIPDWVASEPKRGFVFPFEAWIRAEWQDVFARLDSASPVPLQTWYRRWCLFTLENFLDKNGIDAGRLVSPAIHGQ